MGSVNWYLVLSLESQTEQIDLGILLFFFYSFFFNL